MSPANQSDSSSPSPSPNQTYSSSNSFDLAQTSVRRVFLVLREKENIQPSLCSYAKYPILLLPTDLLECQSFVATVRAEEKKKHRLPGSSIAD